jgi:uncharacterized membrane protein
MNQTSTFITYAFNNMAISVSVFTNIDALDFFLHIFFFWFKMGLFDITNSRLKILLLYKHFH